MKATRSVDDYIRSAPRWQAELKQLRTIVKSTLLTESIKWGGPCYSWKGKNVVGIGAFKSYFGLWFHQGALLQDSAKVLINAQHGKTRAQRQWRMQTSADIKPAIIKRYIKEAKALVDAGKEIKADRSKPVVVPNALGNALRRHNGASRAFKSLSKGRQREYAEFIAAAKRPETIKNRLEKVLPMIMAGIGLNDKYR